MSVRTKFFPIPIINQVLLVTFAFLVGSFIYWWITDSFYNDYKKALEEAQVIENILSRHGESAMTSNERFKDRLILRDYQLTPRDFSIIFIEAGIEKEKDLVKSQDILNVQKNGVGSWIMNAILGTPSQSNANLAQLLLRNPTLELTDCKKPNTVGTLTAMMALFAELGRNDGTGAEISVDSCNVFKPSIHAQAKELVNVLAGDPPMFFPFLDDTSEFSLQDVIKNYMDSQWRIYSTDNITGDTTITTYAYNGSEYEKINGGVGTKALSDTRWFKNDGNASELNNGVFLLGNLFINEVLRDWDVRYERFFYKALKGSIQWGLFVLIFYILFMLMYRWKAAYSGRTSDQAPIISKATIVQGEICDIDRNIAASRTLVDQLISVCPLLGLFGTVTGIMLGLPEAATVVTGGSSDVSALFEQLGLAFSTTAIAVAGVIVLESIWEQLQSYEDHKIWHLSENGHE